MILILDIDIYCLHSLLKYKMAEKRESCVPFGNLQKLLLFFFYQILFIETSPKTTFSFSYRENNTVNEMVAKGEGITDKSNPPRTLHPNPEAGLISMLEKELGLYKERKEIRHSRRQPHKISHKIWNGPIIV